MPSGSKKRKLAKKNKQESALSENGTPDKLQAESEENLENPSDLQEDNNDEPLTPTTPGRDDESEKKSSADIQTDEWLKGPYQYSETPTSADSIHEDTVENRGTREYLDGFRPGDRSELDSADIAASMSSPRDSADPVEKVSAEGFADLESDCQKEIAEPVFAVTRTETPANEQQLTVEYEDVVKSKSQEETSTAAEQSSKETNADLELQDSGDLDATPSPVLGDEDSVVLGSEEKPSEAPGETSVEQETKGEQEFSEKDALPIPISTDDSPDALISQEEPAAADFEAADETTAELELEGQPDSVLTHLSTNEKAADWKSQEEMFGGAEPPDLEFKGQRENVELCTTSLTFSADESSLGSTLQEETSMEMMKAHDETCEGPEFEVPQAPSNLESTPLANPTDETAATVETLGETTADLESSHQEDLELDGTPEMFPTNESLLDLEFQEDKSEAAGDDPGEKGATSELEDQGVVLEQDAASLLIPADEYSIFQEDKSGAAVEAPGETTADLEMDDGQENLEMNATSETIPSDSSLVEFKILEDNPGDSVEDSGENRADLESEDHLEVSEPDATPLVVPADEISVELKFQNADEGMSAEGMKTRGKNSTFLELEDQLEVSNWDARSLAVSQDDSSSKIVSPETSVIVVEAPGEGKSQELAAAPLVLPNDDSSAGCKSGEETSETIVDAFGDTGADRELDYQVEVTWMGAAPFMVSTDEILSETKSQDETSATVVDAVEEASLDSEVTNQAEVVEMAATPLIMSADETSSESKSQEETPATAVEVIGEAISDLELNTQLQVIEADASPLPVLTDESLLESKFQEERSVTAFEGSCRNIPDIEQGGHFEMDATPLLVLPGETLVVSNLQDASATGLESRRGISADFECKSQLEASESVSTPQTVIPDYESSTDFNLEKEKSLVDGEAVEETSLEKELNVHEEIYKLNSLPTPEPTDKTLTELKYQEDISTEYIGEAGDDFGISEKQGALKMDDAADDTRQCVITEESPVNQVFEGQGETLTVSIPNEIGEEKPSAGSQEAGTLDGPDATGPSLLSEFEQEESHTDELSRMPGGTSADIAEVGRSKEESESPVGISNANGRDEQRAFSGFGKRGKAVNGIYHGFLNEETASCDRTAEAANDEDGKSSLALQTRSLNVTDNFAARCIPHGENWLSEISNDKLPGGFGVGAECDNEKTPELPEQADELSSKDAPELAAQRLESSGTLEYPSSGVEDEDVVVANKEESARTRDIDPAQGNQPDVRQQMGKAKWWECCGVFDAFMSRS